MEVIGPLSELVRPLRQFPVVQLAYRLVTSNSFWTIPFDSSPRPGSATSSSA